MLKFEVTTIRRDFLFVAVDSSVAALVGLSLAFVAQPHYKLSDSIMTDRRS